MRHADGGPEVLRVAVGGDHDRATESAEGIAGALQHPAQGDRRWLAITHRIRDPCPEDRADEGLAMPGRADGADIIRIGAGADQRGIPYAPRHLAHGPAGTGRRGKVSLCIARHTTDGTAGEVGIGSIIDDPVPLQTRRLGGQLIFRHPTESMALRPIRRRLPDQQDLGFQQHLLGDPHRIREGIQGCQPRGIAAEAVHHRRIQRHPPAARQRTTDAGVVDRIILQDLDRSADSFHHGAAGGQDRPPCLGRLQAAVGMGGARGFGQVAGAAVDKEEGTHHDPGF